MAPSSRPTAAAVKPLDIGLRQVGTQGRAAAAARPLLIVHLEETRICIDVVCPQQLHHRLHVVGPIVFDIRRHISELAYIDCSGVRGARMWCVRRPGRLVGNTLRRNFKLVSANRRQHSTLPPGGSLHCPSSSPDATVQLSGAVLGQGGEQSRAFALSDCRSIKWLDDTQGSSELLQEDALARFLGPCPSSARVLGLFPCNLQYTWP